MNRAFALLVPFLMLSACSLNAADDPPAPATLGELQDAVAAVIREREVPAVGIAMVDADGPVWVGAFGKADLEKGVPADENTMFRIGSTSKMFVALAVLKLVEEGRLSLDDRVADLAPDVAFENPWEDTDPVRVVHLLEHTTGWDDIHLPEYAHNDPTPVTLKQGLDFHPHSRVSRWRPGTRISYCNSGPPVAAYIVQQITGQDFEDYVRQNFFAPMGMQSATYRLTPEVEARGATLYANGDEPQAYEHIVIRPSGAINASPRDMAGLVSFFVNRGVAGERRLISKPSLERMETPRTTSGARAGQQTGYGLNNYSSVHEQWVYRAHHGGVTGGLTELAYLPEARRGHAIMINSDDGGALREISRLVRAFETRDLLAKTIGAEREISPQNRSIAGYYYPINPRQQVGAFLERVIGIERLWFDQERLARKRLFDDKATYYFPVSDSLYKSADTGLIDLVSVVDPLAGDVVHANFTVLKPTSGMQVYSQLAVATAWGFFIVTSVLFFPVWLVRRLRGRVPAGGPVQVRLWPLLASLAVLAVAGLFAIGMRDPFGELGKPTTVSVGIMLGTLAFAAFAMLGGYAAIRTRRLAMNRGAYWHSTLASALHLAVMLYLLAFGIIGLRTWA